MNQQISFKSKSQIQTSDAGKAPLAHDKAHIVWVHLAFSHAMRTSTCLPGTTTISNYSLISNFYNGFRILT